MSLTRISVETILIRRVGRLLTAASLDGTTVSGANGDLNDPIGWAIRQAGGTAASVTNVADSDLATVADADTDKLLDLAELRSLESALGNLDVVDVEVGPIKEKLDQLGKRLEAAITRKRSQIQRDHGVGLGTLSAGLINLGFQQLSSGETR